MRWKIDDNEELPLAIIEDTEDGAGIAEIGERTERNLAIAAEIVESHNPLATPASTARTDGWVSVEERLPKHCNPVEVMAIRFNGEVMRDYSFFCDGEWDGVEDQGYRIKPKIVYWHELLPLPAAPAAHPKHPNAQSLA